MSSVSSEQSCVCKGTGYDEVYLLGQDNPDTYSSNERIPFANSPSTEEDDDLDVDGLEIDSNKDEGIGSDEPPIQSVIGPEGLRQFILLPLWTMNDFNSTIQRKHFKTLREKYQIPLSVYLSSLRSATTRTLRTSGCMSKC